MGHDYANYGECDYRFYTMCMDYRCACISSDKPKNITLYGEHNTVKLVIKKKKRKVKKSI